MAKFTRRTLFALPAIVPFAQKVVWAAEDPLGDRLLNAVPARGEKSLGDPNARAVLIEYGSATCKHTANFHRDVLPVVKKDFVEKGRLRFIFREMPRDKLAMGAFMLARCVPDDKYFATLEVMLRQQSSWKSGNPKENLFRIVGMAGLTVKNAEACLNDRDLFNSVLATAKKGTEEFGVKTTPTLFVNGAEINEHADAGIFTSALESELARIAKS